MVYWRAHASYERFMQDGVLRDGASFEGMGHNNGQEMQMLVMMARHGGSLLFASETVRNHIEHFHLAVMEPWGFNHTADGIGQDNHGSGGGSFTW